MKIKFTFRTAVLMVLALTSISSQAKDVPGATQTSYGVSSSGAFQFSIPIVVPQGRNGVTPSLSIGYSSVGGNGSMGVGWGLSGFSAITRCGKTFATEGQRGGVQHNANDRFCLNGQKLILVSGTYGAVGSEYRTEIDRFSKIVATGTNAANINGGTAPSSWKVWSKGGQIYHYGTPEGVSTHSAQFRLPGISSIHSWKLARVSDRSGNYYENYYRSEDGLPTEIRYNGSTTRKVTINYETRPDARFAYVQGRKINRNVRVKDVTVVNGGAVFRKYNLAYNTAGVSGRSRLDSVTECGLTGTDCMPPINIAWESNTAGYATSTAVRDKAPADLIEYYTYTQELTGAGVVQEANAVKEINKGAWVDINGDGKLDMVVAVHMPTASAPEFATYLKTDTGWAEDPDWNLPIELRSYQNSIVNGSTGRFASTVVNKGQLLDINGDGYVDIVYAYTLFTDNAQTATPVKVQKVYLSNGKAKGWTESASYKPLSGATEYQDMMLFDYKINGRAGSSTEWNRVETVRSRLVDVNGDGLPDWVAAYHDYVGNGVGNEYKYTWINTGSAWQYTPSYNMPDVFTEYRGALSISHGQFLDANGDGLVDWVQAYDVFQRPAQRNTWLNTGSGFSTSASAAHRFPEVIYDASGGWSSRTPTRRGSFIDINGDGLRDWLRSYQQNSTFSDTGALINTGKGWVADSGYKPPFIHIDHTYANFTRNWPLNIRGQYMDVNRDGLVDYVQSYRTSATGHAVLRNAWLNTGTAWQEVPAGSPYIPPETYFDYSGREKAKTRFGQMIDINNDGASDWVTFRKGVIRTTRLAQLTNADRIDMVTTTLGQTIDPSFSALTSDDDIYTKEPQDVFGVDVAPEANSLFIVSPMYVVASLQVPSPSGSGVNTRSYTYAGAQTNRLGRGFLGFRTFSSVSDLTGLTQYRESSQQYPYIGRSTFSATIDAETVLSSSVNHWQHTTQNRINDGKTYFVSLDYTVSQQSELSDNGGATYRNTRTDYGYDAYGNVTTQVSKVKNGANVLMHTSTVSNTIRPANTANWLIGLVERTTQTNATAGKPAITNVVDYNYYNNGKGQLHQVVREPDSSDTALKLTSTYTYDSFGNIKTESSETPSSVHTRTNTINYDPQNRLPNQLINSLNQAASITYHPQCDAPSTQTDINGLVTTYTYDNFCRQDSAQGPINTISSSVTYQLNNVYCSECSVPAKFKITATSTGNPSVSQYTDAFNQTILSTTQSVDGTPIYQQTQYDDFGRVASSSQPYFLGDNKHVSTYNYDILGRSESTLLPYNNEAGSPAEMSYAYSVSSSGEIVRTATDVENRTKSTYVNALGQVEKIVDAHNKAMRYFYDSQGNLKQTQDVANNTINLNYDLLGRRTVLNDPDLGLNQYEYNGFGEMVSQTNARNQTITSQYDILGRLQTRTVPGAASMGGGQSTFTFDQAPKAGGGTWLGALSKVEGPNGYLQTLQYDQYGRPSSDATTIKGVTLNQRYQYNENGFISQRFYPNSGAGVANQFGVKYGYENGYLTSIMSAEDEYGQCVEHWRANSYDALGRVTNETAGKLVETTRSYKGGQNVLETIQSITLRAGQQTVQNLSYTYDGVNNLKSRTDAMLGSNETFEYDDLDRLRFHNRTGAQTVEVQYDDIGNITYKSDVGHYSYIESGGPHALSKITSGPAVGSDLTQFQVNWDFDGSQLTKALPNNLDQTFQYNATGSITQSGNRTFAWTAFDKPERMVAKTSTDGTARGSVFEYGPTQQRIFKQEAVFDSLNMVTDYKDSTIYLGKNYERITDQDGAVTHRYTIETGGTTIQIERADGSNFDKPKYLLGDNLGSTNVIINALGEVEQTLAFDPWGMRLNVGDSSQVNSITNRGYTGHEMDDEVGLINMNARIYDPYLGRFLSADPVLPDAGDMQQFNRYSYVTNNPLKFTDPTGNNGEHVDGGTDQKPDEIEEIEVIGQAPPSRGSGLNTTTVDIRFGFNGGGSEQIYFNSRTGEIGTAEELWGVEESEVPQIEETTLAEDAEELERLNQDRKDPYAAMGRLATKKRDAAQDAFDVAHERFQNILKDLWEFATDSDRLRDFEAATAPIGGGVVIGGGSKLIAKAAVLFGISKVAKNVDSSVYTYTATVAGHLVSRPYIDSPLLIGQIIKSGKGIADPGGLSGVLRFDVPGSFRGSKGSFELVVNTETKHIYHFLFVSGKK